MASASAYTQRVGGMRPCKALSFLFNLTLPAVNGLSFGNYGGMLSWSGDGAG